MKLLALLSVAMVVYSAPAISANVPAIAASFPEVDAVYVGLLTTIPSLFLLLDFYYRHDEKGSARNIFIHFWHWPCRHGIAGAFFLLSSLVSFARDSGFGIGLFNRLAIQMKFVFQKSKRKPSFVRKCRRWFRCIFA